MVFVDAENISKKLFNGFYNDHPDEQYIVFGKTKYLSSCYLRCKNLQIINCFFNKNSADTFMTAYIVDSIYSKNIYNYYILTHDSDLCIAIKMLTDHDKNITIVSERTSLKQNLKALGANIELISFESYGHRSVTTNFVRVSRTVNNSYCYDECPNRAWFKREDGIIIESPFRNGMPLTTLKKFLWPYAKTLGIGPSKSWKKLIESCYLKIYDGKVYWLSEEELYVL